MRQTRIFMCSPLLLAATNAIAENEFPGIEYGLWETTSTTTEMTGEMSGLMGQVDMWVKMSGKRIGDC